MKMAQTHKVAIIQLYCEPMQLSTNFDKASTFIRSAATQGAKLAVLPEYHLTSWVPEDPGFLDACDQWETYLKKYQDLAREVGICICPGTFAERHEQDGDKKSTLANVAYFIGKDGNVLGKYVKKNLWHPERNFFTSSTADIHPVFDTPLGKVGMLICWDLAFPEAFRELISQGAKLIIIPTFWTLRDCSKEGLAYNPSSEALFVDSILTARAFENTCAIIFVNAGGPPGQGFAGLSQVTVPFIGPITRLGGAAEGMSVVDLDMRILDIAEDNYKVRADLARKDWYYTYRHSSGSKE